MNFWEKIKHNNRDAHLRPSLSLNCFEEGWSFCLFGFWIPIEQLAQRDPQDMLDAWGVYYHSAGIVFEWGPDRRWRFEMPWSHVHIRHEVWNNSGKWVPYIGSWEKSKGSDHRRIWKYPFTYRLQNGTVQNTTATIYKERHIRRWRLFRYIPWLFDQKCISISIDFDREIGEGTGSYKGGTLGCGYELKKGESPYECLRRMEQYREFN